MKTKSKLILQILFLCFALVFIYIRPVRLIMVNGESMMPTYRSHQPVFAVRSSHYDRGDIVVLKENNEQLIKRIAATAGDKFWCLMWYDQVGITQTECFFGANAYVEAKAYSHDIAKALRYNQENKRHYMVLKQRTVSKNCVFLLGDNRKASLDSRFFGEINVKNIMYKVIEY